LCKMAGILNERERRELPLSAEVGVWSEIAPLRKLIIWGEPGCETALGQLLPQNESLFLENFDVAIGRGEYIRMKQMFLDQGVELVVVKDAYAKVVERQHFPSAPKSLQELERKMIERAIELYEKHHIGNLEKIIDWIPGFLAADMESYGEDSAIKLNWILSLAGEKPMSNLFYARDQSNVIGDRIVMSKMRYPIRVPEVELYRQAYEQLGLGSLTFMTSQGTIEGGDTMIWGDTCYIGVAVRTSREAVEEIYRGIGKRLEEKGIKMAIVENQELVELNKKLGDNPTDDDMNSMHLDTFWTPLGPDTALACMEEVSMRSIAFVSKKDGRMVFEEAENFAQYMERRGFKVINVTRQEQHDYSTNLLHLGNGTVIVPLEKNERVINELRKIGLNVLTPDIKELVGGYGAVHCMTASLVRG